MPVMDGFEAIRTLRNDGGDLARVPIIAVSASAFDETRAQSAAVGCDAFIAKPIRLDEVINVLSNHLRLEWTRGAVRAPPSAANASQSRLPAKLARELYDLAMQGDVRALADKLREARSRDAGHSEAWTELADLAGSYDMKALRNALRPHAERSE
jgi:DNA-binding response OmpR family regulator